MQMDDLRHTKDNEIRNLKFTVCMIFAVLDCLEQLYQRGLWDWNQKNQKGLFDEWDSISTKNESEHGIVLYSYLIPE